VPIRYVVAGIISLIALKAIVEIAKIAWPELCSTKTGLLGVMSIFVHEDESVGLLSFIFLQNEGPKEVAQNVRSKMVAVGR
jgi:hypothetical protein